MTRRGRANLSRGGGAFGRRMPAPAAVSVAAPESTPNFVSNWSNSTGNSAAALRDGTTWPFVDNDGEGFSVGSASGLGFPAGLTNVYTIPHTDASGTATNTVGSVRIRSSDELIPVPAVGEAIWHRYYFRQSITDNPGNLGAGSNHGYQNVPSSTGGCGNCNTSCGWEFHFSNKDDGTFDLDFHLNSKSPSQYVWSPSPSKDRTYLIEVGWTRKGVDSYAPEIWVDGVDESANFASSAPETIAALRDGAGMTLGDGCVTNLHLGGHDAGPTWRQGAADPNPLFPHTIADTGQDGPDPSRDFVYYGAFAIRVGDQGRIGPFSEVRGW